MANRGRWRVLLAVLVLVSATVWLLFFRRVPAGPSPAPVVVTTSAPSSPSVDAGVLLTLRAPARSAPLADEPPGNVVVDGLVIDEDDAPVPDAVVFIDSRPQRKTSTDARGEWHFEGLAPREYTLAAVRGTLSAGPVTGRFLARQDPVVLRLVHPPRRLSVTVIDERTNERIPGAHVEAQGLTRSEATTNRVGEANMILVDGVDPVVMLRVIAAGYTPLEAEVTLGPEGGTCLLGLSRGGPVAVRVTAATDGRPVEKARVTLFSERLSLLDPGARPSAVTEPAGMARFEAIAPGRWHVEVEHPDYENFSTSRALESGAVLEVQLTKGISVTGRVLHADGAPAAKASVNSSSPWRWATCDEQGRFSIRGLRAGRQVLDARLGSATAPRLELDLAEGVPAPDVTLTLRGRGVISGMVVGPDRKGVKAEIHATSADGAQFGSAEAGKDGLFEFTNLDPVPTWTLQAKRTVYLPSNPNPFSSSESEPRTARVGDVSVVLEVPSSAAVRGRVLFSDGSAPATFKVEVGPRPKQEISGSDGAFEVVDVKAGRVLFMVTGPDFLPHEAMVQLLPGVVTDLGTIVVSRGRTLRGRVMNGTWPVAGATIWVGGRGDDGRALNVLTRSDGTFELPFLELRATFVTARHPTLGRARSRQIPAGTQDVDVTLSLEKTTTLSGRLLRGGLPLAAWPVEARFLDDPRMGAGRQTGSDGRFVIPDLVPGRWSLSVPSKTFLFMNRQWIVLPSPVDVVGDLDVGDLIVPLGKTLHLSAREAGILVLISGEVVPPPLVGHRELALRMLGERGGEWRYVYMPATTREVKDLLPGRVRVCRVVKPNGSVRVEDDLGVESCASLVVDDTPVQQFTLP